MAPPCCGWEIVKVREDSLTEKIGRQRNFWQTPARAALIHDGAWRCARAYELERAYLRVFFLDFFDFFFAAFFGGAFFAAGAD
jgi:hypothetical protein